MPTGLPVVFFKDELLKEWVTPGAPVSYGHSGKFSCDNDHYVPNKCLPGGEWEKPVPKCNGKSSS